MASRLLSFIPRKITPDQSKDTGMAMTLLALIVFSISHQRCFLPAAIVLLVLTMTVPAFYKPVAMVWLGLSHLMGTVVSKILLTVIFFTVITPIGFLKRLSGSEPLQLKRWKKDTSSLFTERNHAYSANDVMHPY